MQLHLPVGIALVVCVAAGGGCSSNTLNGGLPNVCMEFEPDPSCSTAHIVARQGAASTCDAVRIELIAKGDGSLTDVFGAMLSLGRDPEQSFLSSADGSGSFLGADGTSLIVVPSGSSSADPLPIAITRSGVSTGASPTADLNLLITLVLLRFADSGSAPLTLEDGDPGTDDAALLSPGAPPLPKSGITFCGGTLTIN